MTAFVASFNLPSRTRPVVLSYFPGKDAVYDPSYLLLKEPRESWQHIVSDKVVYSLNSREVQGKSLAKVAEDYLKLNLWIECHLTLEACGQTRHVVLAIEFDELASRYWQIGKHENALASVDRDSPVLVNIAHQVELPEQMASEGTGIPSVVRLERFDDRRCPAGTPLVYRSNLLGFGVSKIGNWVFRGYWRVNFARAQTNWSSAARMQQNRSPAMSHMSSGGSLSFIRKRYRSRSTSSSPTTEYGLDLQKASSAFRSESRCFFARVVLR